MFNGATCCCCLVRPPDKDLKSSYSRLGKSEIYSEMLKDCFAIHMADASWHEGGICEICITRLRDAFDFKQQVQKCQTDIEAKLLPPKVESCPKVKDELPDTDDDNDIYVLALKDEVSDFENDLLKNDEDNKKLAKVFGFNNVTVNKFTEKRSKKRQIRSTLKDEVSDYENDLLKDDEDNKKLAEVFGFNNVTVNKFTEKRSKKRQIRSKGKTKKDLSNPVKISFRALTQMSKYIASKKETPSIILINDNMKHKINIENILKHSNCTPFLNKTLLGIICAYCKETYTDLQLLQEHVQTTHKNDSIIDNKRMDKSSLTFKVDITDLKCNICQTKTKIITDLKEHLISEHDIKFYRDIKDYILEFKLTDGDILNCALCNSTFETFKMLLQHMNRHYRNYICDICDLGFINKHKLRNHQRTHDVGTFNCLFCEKVFSTRVRKLCHEKYTHNSNARYTTNCPQCDQSFTSYYQRNRHMTIEHNTSAATYKCNICDKSFILKSKLTSHIKKVHLMERNHICAECGQGFFIKQSLDEHMIKHNGERIYKCTVCNKAYARKKTLREHMRIHNNDRRFKCGLCPLAFVQKCSLKSHMLSNHGITLAEYENAKPDAIIP